MSVRCFKARLAAAIARTIVGRKLTQAAAVDLMGIDQPGRLRVRAGSLR